jgi:hypothetical protein
MRKGKNEVGEESEIAALRRREMAKARRQGLLKVTSADCYGLDESTACQRQQIRLGIKRNGNDTQVDSSGLLGA